MAYKKSKRILRYFLISLGSAVGCTVVISLLTCLFMIIDDILHEFTSMSYDPLFTILAAPLQFVFMGTILGLPIALPAAMIMGGAMLKLQKRYSILRKEVAWIVVGLISGAIISIFFPIMQEFTGHKQYISNIATCSIGGATGAWIFLKLWRRYPLPPLPDSAQI